MLFEIYDKFRDTVLWADRSSLENILRSFAQFTVEKHRIVVKMSAKKVESLFPLKDHNLQPFCKFYKAICSHRNT